MSNFVAQIGDVLAGDSEFTRYLETYNGEPAIFTTDPIPEDAPLPAAVIRGPFGGPRVETRGQRGGLPQYDVAVYGPKTDTWKAIRDAAWQAWELLHRADLSSPSGYETIGVTAEMPNATPDEDGFPGFVVSLSLQILEEA